MTHLERRLVRYATFVGGVEGIMRRADQGADIPEVTVAKIRTLLAWLHADEEHTR